MLMARSVGAVVAASVALAACNLVFGIEPGAPGGTAGTGATGGIGGAGGSGAAGGTGGSGAGVSCPPDKPATCDAMYLDDGDNCCVAGRNCGNAECVAGECLSDEIVKSGDGEEGISVVVAGDYVLWSSGYAQSVYRTDRDGDGLLAPVPKGSLGFEYVTMLAAEAGPAPEFLYFTDYGGPALGRVSIEDGGPELFAVVPADKAPGAAAGFGRILVHGDFVYWAMDHHLTPPGSSHIWRAPRRPVGALPVTAELVVLNDGAFGLAGDAEHLYFGDTAQQTVERLSWADIGQKDANGDPKLGQPEIVVSNVEDIGDVALDDEYVYWALYDEVRAQKKSESNGTMVPVGKAASYVWGILADGRDVYFTSRGDSATVQGELYRAPRGTANAAKLLYQTNPAVGPDEADGLAALAGSCDAVYFLTYETGAVRKLTK